MTSRDNQSSHSAKRKVVLKFDEDGFLTDPKQWNESLARLIAACDGFGELSQEHWSIIQSMRDEYFKYRAPPVPRFVCHINHMQKNCMGELFDNDRREAWRIAGLPNPGEEAKAYL